MAKNEKKTYALKDSLMFMKRKKAGSHVSPSLWHASTHDWSCSDIRSLSAERGGHDEKELELEAHARILELGRGVKRP